jgi:hypothetical protein
VGVVWLGDNLATIVPVVQMVQIARSGCSAAGR